MRRAWQTPHGARPNREEAGDFGLRHVPARCVKPPGRSLEPSSNAGPRGMTVLPEQSGRQNSAYRFGCFLYNGLRGMRHQVCQFCATSVLPPRQFPFLSGSRNPGKFQPCRRVSAPLMPAPAQSKLTARVSRSDGGARVLLPPVFQARPPACRVDAAAFSFPSQG